MITVTKPTWRWSDFNHNTFPYITKHLEKCGRTCYRSEDRITDDSADRFVEKICRSQHESVLEHATLTAHVKCSRACSHQLVRHRLAAYCLSGETVLRSFGSQKRWSMKQLYDWSKDPKRKGCLKLIRLRSVDRNGLLVPGEIKSIVSSGKQKVFKVTTKFGRELKSTLKHRFMTPGGWKRLGDLKTGDKVMANGVPSYKNPEWLWEMYRERNMSRPEVAKLAGVSDAWIGKWVKHFEIQKDYSEYARHNRKPGRGVPGMHSTGARKVISERMSGENNHRWKGDAVGIGGGHVRCNKLFEATECETCDSLNNLERHHVDKDPRNNNPANIMILCSKCHSHWHRGQGTFSVFSDTIVSIEEAGEEATFDIEMKGVNHNFVANGMVVHNSQESMRFCNYKTRGLQVICPPSIGVPPGEYDYTSSDTLALLSALQRDWVESQERAYREYLRLIADGIPPEDARFSLPIATKTELAVTLNLRMWRHVVRERALNPKAQLEIRGIFTSIYEDLVERLPAVFRDLKT